MAIAQRPHRWRRPLIILALLLTLVAVTAVTWPALQGLFSPYLSPWEWAFWTGRHVIRVLWAAMTGQSTDVDLFPS